MYRVLRPAYRPVTAAAVIGLGVVLCTTLATLTLAGGPPSWTGWRVGELAETAIPLDDAESAALQMRARTLLGELGIQTNRLTSARAFDNLRQSRVDSVTGSNAAGEPTVDVEWETGSGRLQSVTRYLRDIGPSSVELDPTGSPRRRSPTPREHASRSRLARRRSGGIRGWRRGRCVGSAGSPASWRPRTDWPCGWCPMAACGASGALSATPRSRPPQRSRPRTPEAPPRTSSVGPMPREA
jgi:hypothetical protein